MSPLRSAGLPSKVPDGSTIQGSEPSVEKVRAIVPAAKVNGSSNIWRASVVVLDEVELSAVMVMNWVVDPLSSGGIPLMVDVIGLCVSQAGRPSKRIPEVAWVVEKEREYGTPTVAELSSTRLRVGAGSGITSIVIVEVTEPVVFDVVMEMTVFEPTASAGGVPKIVRVIGS